MRRPALIASLFVPGILLLMLPFYRPGEVPSVLLLFGRLHPLILHFPIVLTIISLLFEVTRYYRLLKVADSVILIVLFAAALSTLVSIGAGFFLFASGDYSGDLMARHFWAGILTGFFIFTSTGLFLVYWSTGRFYFVYLAALVISNIVVAYASHLGGSITHGQDYLTEHLDVMLSDSESQEVRPESEMLVYDDMIAPILEAKCLSCHNAQKAKGNFLMTSFENILKPGESKSQPVTPGLSGKSEVFKRVTLAENHKDHMPPAGKTPMTESEISLLKFWIDAGAKKEHRVLDAKKEKEAGTIIANLLPELSRYRRKAEIANMRLKSLHKELELVATALSIVIKNDTTNDEGYFTIGMSFPPAPFTNEQFKLLHPYAAVFSKASLVSSGIDDAGLYYVGQMSNLEKLYLQKTKLDGSGLVYLQKLPKLKVLNLSFTKVDDKAAIDLLKFPSLEEVYLYRTNTSKEVVNALEKYKPGLKIYLQEGPYF